MTIASCERSARLGGSAAAGRIRLTTGSRKAVGSMLAGSAFAAGVLVGTQEAWLYVALAVAAAFLGIGAWPIVVDGALARVSPGLSVTAYPPCGTSVSTRRPPPQPRSAATCSTSPTVRRCSRARHRVLGADLLSRTANPHQDL